MDPIILYVLLSSLFSPSISIPSYPQKTTTSEITMLGSSRSTSQSIELQINMESTIWTYFLLMGLIVCLIGSSSVACNISGLEAIANEISVKSKQTDY
ncbi:hypothetical protein RJ641_012952, partial [Dillenia turbinata]